MEMKEPDAMAAKVQHHRPPEPGLLDWLSSLKLGLVLLTLVGIASIAATLIDPLPKAQQLVYFTWWYKVLLLLLAVNIACATWRTVTRRVLPLRRLRPMRQKEYYRTAPLRTDIAFHGTAEAVAQAFGRRRFRVAREGEFGHARRGYLSRWGAPVSHVGFVMVLAGGFLSPFFMIDGYVRLAEGQATDTVHLRGEKGGTLALDYQVRVEDFDLTYFPQTEMPASFVSTVSILEGGRTVKTGPVEVNRSLKHGGLKFHQTGYGEQPSLARHAVELTHPRQAPAGIQFDLSPGQVRAVPGLPGYEIALHAHAPPHWVLSDATGPMAEGAIGGVSGPVTIRAERFEPDFVIGPNRQVGSRSAELRNPALEVSLIEGETAAIRRWLFGKPEMRAMSHGGGGPFDLELAEVRGEGESRRFVLRALAPDTGVEVDRAELALGESATLGEQAAAETPVEDATDWRLEIVGRAPAYTTDLSVTRNPLIPFIYLGCGLMLLGLVLAFFVKQRDAWFHVDAARGRLWVVAAYRHPHGELDRVVRSVVEGLREPEAIPGGAPAGEPEVARAATA